MSYRHLMVLALFASLPLGMWGCTSGNSKPVEDISDNEPDSNDAPVAADNIAPQAPVEFKFGDLIEPFSPPTLDELNETVEWQDRPVLDSLALLREKLAKEQPLATVEQALALKNDSPADNEKIKSALGQLPESEDKVNWDAEINRHGYGDVNSTNPLLSSSVIESEVTGLMAFGLFSFDWQFNPFASSDTVKSWQTSKDGMIDKVVMRDDLTWSDGTPITAHDVVHSFKAIMTSAIPIPALRSGTDKLKWVEAYDDHTLVYFQKEPYATNVWTLNFSVVPKHIYPEEKLAADPTLVNDPYFVKLENAPVVGGPYVIKSRTRGQEIILERRDSYYEHDGKQVRDKPHFKTIRFRIRPDLSVALLALKAGDIDEMQLAPEMWRTQTNDAEYYRTNTKASALEWTEFHFVWNLADPLFADKRVRKALAYAMDYEELIERLRYGLDEQCSGVFHPSAKWAPQPAPPLFVQDLDKAEELLDEAGWTDSDGDGIRDKIVDGKKVDFRFSMLTVNKQDRVDICTLMRECLDQIGIKCDIKALEFPVVVDNLHKKQFQAAFGGWGTGADPYTLENIFKTGEERNYGSYSSPEVDELFEQGMLEHDLEKRAEIYRKIALRLYEDQPYTWLFYQNAFYGFNKSLRGYNFSPRGPYSYGPGFGAIWKAATP
ncbi:MAG: ABC transporter substrate-binding protein [Pirellulaceae bacterium]|nr:ABC transporter substrate-binding protein [Pirellulaceae bacterium]